VSGSLQFQVEITPACVSSDAAIMARYFIGLLLVAFGFAAQKVEAQREFRGAWVATVHNLDWPSRPGLSAGAQQAELRAILDRAAA
jgi:uncharacterized lipoprotein YddW (UPF0748 family)